LDKLNNTVAGYPAGKFGIRPDTGYQKRPDYPAGYPAGRISGASLLNRTTGIPVPVAIKQCDFAQEASLTDAKFNICNKKYHVII
jgi:hypothetical protein